MALFQGKNVLITGASSGIGESLAKEFASQGANLVLMARRKSRLDEVKAELKQNYPSINILTFETDVTLDNSVANSVKLALAEMGNLDVVVANAGFGVAGNVSQLSLEDYRRQFETNLFGVLRIIKETIATLKSTQGRLAVVGSVNGYVSLPGISAYAISKFGVRALCDALYCELKPDGISVTHIAPGFVVSEIRRVNNRGEFREKAKDPIPLWLQMESSIAAKKILKSIYYRRRERVITGHGWWIVRLARFFPSVLFFLIRFFNIKARMEPKV